MAQRRAMLAAVCRRISLLGFCYGAVAALENTEIRRIMRDAEPVAPLLVHFMIAFVRAGVVHPIVGVGHFGLLSKSIERSVHKCDIRSVEGRKSGADASIFLRENRPLGRFFSFWTNALTFAQHYLLSILFTSVV